MRVNPKTSILGRQISPPSVFEADLAAQVFESTITIKSYNILIWIHLLR